MNVFSMFLNSLRMASKCENIGYRAGAVDSAALIDELCEPTSKNRGESSAVSEDALFDGPIAYPS